MSDVEPDAARVNYDIEKYDESMYMSWSRLQGETLNSNSKVEPLFSAETILQRHEELVEEMEKKHGFKRKTYTKANEKLLEELKDFKRCSESDEQ